MSHDTSAESTEKFVEVTLYWRPGCGFCQRLRRGLDREAIVRIEINIWEETDAAAVVRAIANGNETVPTVVIEGRGMVNPSVDDVLEAIAIAKQSA